MADPSLNLTALAMQDPLNQNITIIGADGFQNVVSLTEIDANQKYAVRKTIAYSVEFGASLVMLGVILAMTPRSKFWRLALYINVAALCNNLVRTILLAIFFESSWTRFYVLYTGDNSVVTEEDFRNSVCSVVFSIPQNLLMMAALMFQAWAMVKLWPDIYKWGILIFSGLLSLAEVAFMLVAQADQIRSFYPVYNTYEFLTQRLWLRYTWLALELASVCWFCLMFILRLVTHMWSNRSFLPSTKGVAAMDVLVMTNGVLMLIPVVFVALQLSDRYIFETGSLVYTSVIIVLPLGTLVAQRVADPGAFNSEASRGGTKRGGNASDRYDASVTGKKSLLPSWRQSDNTCTVYSGHRGSKYGAGKTGVTSTVTSDRFARRNSDAMREIDMELARIDDDLEKGRVRVNREFQRSEEVL
ncbi:pheromone receptor 2 [Diaporthe amygdali]|uniref:pheromone receptor 2 n=1 Tax=Phomopsis amygdali TaxID=1214568 RepID=UPI0022FF0E53|nr:pheromone receptor 2 [Diaporthe amygdali]KAJ0120190.1 pheromone receptor 2 [Diaporthe amygdali]